MFGFGFMLISIFPFQFASAKQTHLNEVLDEGRTHMNVVYMCAVWSFVPMFRFWLMPQATHEHFYGIIHIIGNAKAHRHKRTRTNTNTHTNTLNTRKKIISVAGFFFVHSFFVSLCNNQFGIVIPVFRLHKQSTENGIDFQFEHEMKSNR